VWWTANQTPEVLIHVIQSAVEEAQKKIHVRKENSPTRYRESWRIRMVIDDYSILRILYPAVREDPLFLPFLLFYLKREGISTLIIDTQTSRPDRESPTLMDDELRALADNNLYTWRVPFYGESRIAISAIPPINPKERSRVRELSWDPNLDLPELPAIDRNLELYEGLEQGIPQQVPLRVELYAETDAFAQYIAEANAVLRELFAPFERSGGQGSRQLVTSVGPHEYGELHDFCNLQGSRLLDHTLILQVDEFWAVGTKTGAECDSETSDCSPLRAEKRYLGADLDHPDNDPYRLFEGPSVDPESHEGKTTRRRRRSHYFVSPDVELDTNGEVCDGVDRVPFVWEFGFLLCRNTAWEDAAKLEVHISDSHPTVQSIIERLPNSKGHLEQEVGEKRTLEEKETPTQEDNRRASWREFLGACQIVSQQFSARNEQAPAFDISTASGESFLCLMLEIWASEMLRRLKRGHSTSILGNQQDFIECVGKKKWTHGLGQRSLDLCSLLLDEACVIDFYKAWLLIVDSLPLNALVNPKEPHNFAERFASPKAVASRQWYKTACQLTRQPENLEYLAVGLPGHFSVRGDWFLGVIRGSRSDLLADRALDLLSSQRSNHARLDLGLGLPTRRLRGASDNRALRTGLSWDDRNKNRRTVRYPDLVRLGGRYPSVGSHSDFHWFWRSGLRNYHQQCRILQRWAGRTILMWVAIRIELSSGWRSGFNIYDKISEQNPTSYDDMAVAMKDILAGDADEYQSSWTRFLARCDRLQELLST
jgi:hypothetical protein